MSRLGNRLQIAPSTDFRIFTRFRDTGDVAPLHEAATKDYESSTIATSSSSCHAVVHKNSCFYLREICQAIDEATGVTVSESTVCRTLRRMGFTRKKAQQIARLRCIDFRAAIMAQVLRFPRDFFVWVDETGSDARTNIRRFGYSLFGQSPQYTRLLTRGKRVSAIAAISSEGLFGVELKSGSVNGDVFFGAH